MPTRYIFINGFKSFSNRDPDFHGQSPEYIVILFTCVTYFHN